MAGALTELLPIAIAISPIPIVAVILMLLSERGATNATAFLGGWTLALLFTAGGAAALDLGLAHGGDAPPAGLTVARLTLATILLGVAVRRWRGRPRAGDEPRVPAWLATVRSIGARGAAALGFALIALNPKDGLLSLLAGSRLSDATLATPQAAGTLAIFAVLASSTIVLPLCAVAARGERADPILERGRAGLERHGSAVTAVIALAFGVMVALNALLALD